MHRGGLGFGGGGGGGFALALGLRLGLGLWLGGLGVRLFVATLEVAGAGFFLGGLGGGFGGLGGGVFPPLPLLLLSSPPQSCNLA